MNNNFCSKFCCFHMYELVLIISCNFFKHFHQKPAAKPMQGPPNFSSAAPYVGSGAPSSMYLGMPPYGSSLFNGSSIPPYDVPFSGGSAYHYNYGSRLSAGTPYRPLHMAGPAPYSGGSMMGNGKLYPLHSSIGHFNCFVMMTLECIFNICTLK